MTDTEANNDASAASDAPPVSSPRHHVCFTESCKLEDGPATIADLEAPMEEKEVLEKCPDEEEEEAETASEETTTQTSTADNTNNNNTPPFAAARARSHSHGTASSWVSRNSSSPRRRSIASRSHALRQTVLVPFVDWTPDRQKWTAFGCLSSCLVLGVRLWLDREPTAYLIHAIIVFFDMILIHLFTHSPWLSVAGELTTVAYVLAFTLTKETLYELLETTTIAALCSFHIMTERNRHKGREKVLATGVEHLRQQAEALLEEEELGSRASLRNIQLQTSILLGEIEDLDELEELYNNNNTEEPHPGARGGSKDVEDKEEFQHNSTGVNRRSQRQHTHCHPRATLKAADHDDDDGDSEANATRHNGSEAASTLHRHHWYIPHRVHVCGGNFFEHFLDGSAGVMYTSFLGLILDEIIKNVQNADKCK